MTRATFGASNSNKELAKKLAVEQSLETALELQTPLAFLLGIMRDDSYPPGIRVECAKASLPFCHAKKAEEATTEPVQITRIERVIIKPSHDPDLPEHQEEVHHTIVEPGATHSNNFC
jgi:hypothetical protein